MSPSVAVVGNEASTLDYKVIAVGTSVALIIIVLIVLRRKDLYRILKFGSLKYPKNHSIVEAKNSLPLSSYYPQEPIVRLSDNPFRSKRKPKVMRNLQHTYL